MDFHSVLLAEVDRQCVSGPGCPPGIYRPPHAEQPGICLPSSKEKEAKFSHMNGEGGANNPSWHKAASSICLEVEGETDRQNSCQSLARQPLRLTVLPGGGDKSPRILLIFLCLENKRSDHRNKGEGEISFLGDFKKYHCLSVLEKRRVVTWGREEGQGHPWVSLNGRNPGLGDLEKGDAGP